VNHRMRVAAVWGSAIVAAVGVKVVSDDSARRAAHVVQEQAENGCSRTNARFRQVSQQLVQLGGNPVPVVDCARAYGDGVRWSDADLQVCPRGYRKVLGPGNDTPVSCRPE
jgi:hypothetical protein